MDSVEPRLVMIFNDVLWGETIPVRERSRLNCLHWDSLAHMNLVLSLEQEFHISLTDTEVIELNSFEIALMIINEKMTTDS